MSLTRMIPLSDRRYMGPPIKLMLKKSEVGLINFLFSAPNPNPV